MRSARANLEFRTAQERVVNRRGFLKIAFGAAAVTAIPVVLTRALERRLPVIYGDGVHDDTEGLQAALDGREFICRDSCVTVYGTDVFMHGGNYRISQTLHVGRGLRGAKNATIMGCRFDSPNTLDPFIRIHSEPL